MWHLHLRFANCKCKCSFLNSYLYLWRGTICFLKNPTLRRPRLHLCILFQTYDSDYSQSYSNPSLFLAFPIQHVLLTLVADQETLVGAIETIGIVSMWVFRPSPLTISTCSFFGTCTPSGDERKFDGVGI
jgi:hypothetical protein